MPRDNRQAGSRGWVPLLPAWHLIDQRSKDRLPDRYARLLRVEDAEALTGQPLPDLLAERGVEVLTRTFPDGRSEDALRVPMRFLVGEND